MGICENYNAAGEGWRDPGIPGLGLFPGKKNSRDFGNGGLSRKKMGIRGYHFESERRECVVCTYGNAGNCNYSRKNFPEIRNWTPLFAPPLPRNFRKESTNGRCIPGTKCQLNKPDRVLPVSLSIRSPMLIILDSITSILSSLAE